MSCAFRVSGNSTKESVLNLLTLATPLLSSQGETLGGEYSPFLELLRRDSEKPFNVSPMVFCILFYVFFICKIRFFVLFCVFLCRSGKSFAPKSANRTRTFAACEGSHIVFFCTCTMLHIVQKPT